MIPWLYLFAFYGFVENADPRRKPNLDDFLILEDFKKYAEQYMPKSELAYVQSGSMFEQTKNDNEAAFTRIRLLHKLLRDTTDLDIRTTILGHHLSLPIAISPNGIQMLESPNGENDTAKAALAEKTLMILSAHSSVSMEEMAAFSPKTMRWFQVTNFKNRNKTIDLLKRAKKSGYTAIVLTADQPIAGDHLRARRAKFDFKAWRMGNLDRYGDWYLSPSLTWRDLKWMKAVTGLPLVIKGILTAEDADLAVKNGADAIIVSSHGGRQMDGSPASIEALPDVVKGVRGRAEVYLDSGVRLGSDVVKAIALGARAVFIGRPNLYGLFAGGVKGARKVLQILRDELKLVMHIIGATNLSELDHTFVKREMCHQYQIE